MDEPLSDGADSLELTLFDLPRLEGPAERLARTGIRQQSAGHYEDAARTFEQAIELAPDNPLYRVSLADAYRGLAESGQVTDPEMVEALTNRSYRHLMEAVRLNPDCASAYMLLGFVYQSMEAPWRAREMWAAYLDMEPDGVHVQEVTQALDNLDRVQHLHHLCEEASYLINHGESEHGLRLLEEVVEEEPGWYEAWFWRGLACRELENVDGGIEAFARAIELDPESQFAHHELAALLARKGEHEAAEGFWRKALEIDPEEPWIMANLALLLWRDERRAEAEALFVRALDIDPANRKLRVQLRNLQAGEVAPPLDL